MKNVKRFAYMAMATFGLTLSLHAYAGDGNKNIDAAKSSVKWTGEKVSGTHYGKVKVKSGNVDIKNGSITGGSITIDMTTITCDDIENKEYNGKLVGHLNSPDFFNVEAFKTAEFKITKVIPSGKGKVQLVGKLTIKGITKDIEFMVTETEKAGVYSASGQMKINRTLYDIKYGSGSFFEGLGDKMIYDDILLDFTIVTKS